MIVKKDDPKTWRKYKENLCSQCMGTCCTMPVEVKAEDLLHLGLISEDELAGGRRKLANRLKRDQIIQSYREATQLFMLAQRPNGDCLFLDEKSRLCTVYENRPEVCRQFPNIGLRPGYCPAIPKK